MDSIQNMFDSAVYRARSALYKMKESALGQTLRGVEGELNGQTSFGGTPTQDPHHGTGSQEDYQPVVNDCTPDQAGKDKIAAFAAGYSGGWSWRFEFGNHCHTFQKALMDECGYDKYKVIK
jgi:hypothetical protein